MTCLEIILLIFFLFVTVPMFVLAYFSHKDDLKSDKAEESYREQISILYKQKKNLEIEINKLNRFIESKKENKKTLYFPPEDLLDKEDV